VFPIDQLEELPSDNIKLGNLSSLRLIDVRL
jgi:hypothetical protein